MNEHSQRFGELPQQLAREMIITAPDGSRPATLTLQVRAVNDTAFDIELTSQSATGVRIRPSAAVSVLAGRWFRECRAHAETAWRYAVIDVTADGELNVRLTYD